MPTIQTWYDKHKAGSTLGDRVADKVVKNMGSWRFIIIQTVFVLGWIILNFTAFIHHWDPYPFILLNLLFSTQAAYASPLILMAANRQADRDKMQALHQYQHQEKELKLNTALTEEIHTLTTEIHEHFTGQKKS